jgi:cytochrome c-type biogenesis protein CcmE
MTRKKRRLYMLGLALLGLGTATALALTAFEDNLVFFYSPSDLAVQHVGERSFRLGGLVEQNSVKRMPDGLTIEFRVTDTAQTVPVTYSGIVPDRSARDRVSSPKVGCGPTAFSSHVKCWQSTMRNTCRRK